MSAATWAPKDEAERAAVVELCAAMVNAWCKEGRHGDGPRSVAERVVPPVPTRTREYPRVVLLRSSLGRPVAVTYECGAFCTHYADKSGSMYSHLLALPMIGGVPDDTIVELLSLKSNAKETVTLPEDAPRVVGYAVVWPEDTCLYSSLRSARQASEWAGTVHELLLGNEVAP